MHTQDSDRIRIEGGGHAVDAPVALLEVLQDGRALAAHPANDWPEMLRELWRLGLVFLRDEASSVDPSTSFFRVFRVIVQRSWIGAFSTLKGGPIALRDSHIEGHAAIVGPIELDASGLGHHTYVGTYASIRRSFVGPFGKAQVGIDLDGVLVASHAALDGGTHADFMPLAAGVAAEGVRVGPQSWIGQHASLAAGAVLGRGVVVAMGTTLARAVSDHHFVAGEPARDFPIDWHIRHLDASAARDAGRAQGPTAAMLPIFGTPRVRWHDSHTLALDFDYDSSGRLPDFHAGALAALLAQLVPDAPVQIEREASTTSFRARFDRVLDPHVPPSTDLLVALRRDGVVEGRLAAALPATVGELVARAIQERWLQGSISDSADAVASEVSAMARAGLLQVRLSQPVAQAFCRDNVSAIGDVLAAGPPPASVVDQIADYLRANGVLSGNDGVETSLISSGRLDSFGLAALLTFLEASFGIVINTEDVTAAEFERASSIADYVERRQRE